MEVNQGNFQDKDPKIWVPLMISLWTPDRPCPRSMSRHSLGTQDQFRNPPNPTECNCASLCSAGSSRIPHALPRDHAHSTPLENKCSPNSESLSSGLEGHLLAWLVHKQYWAGLGQRTDSHFLGGWFCRFPPGPAPVPSRG